MHVDGCKSVCLMMSLRTPLLTLTLITLFMSLDPPKNVLVSIRPASEIVGYSSVTLTCSSDANPPVQNYAWFKEGGTSPVGSGQTYNITISSNSSGWYYCVAQNEHGMLKSASIDATLKGHFYILPIAVGIGLCGIVLPLSIVLFMKRESLRR
ncbi:B-cell receptor CD22-like [Electrophorus electricus]|uniref:B-cell receptor CD22-like n=1 Tax=Electrophorus electricus TaxID=8005 RepID=UPI0015D0119E|nr:B-cell receptor CD22-like [Electrophorus electricus]